MKKTLVILIALVAMTVVGCKEQEPTPAPDANQTQTEMTAPEAPAQPEMDAEQE